HQRLEHIYLASASTAAKFWCGKIETEAKADQSRMYGMPPQEIKGRPSCKICTDKAISCQYSVEEGVTQQQATKEQLKSYKDVLALLRNSSSRDCDAIIHILKSMEDLNDACRFILDAPVLLPGK
ncbi:hypothetical protein D6D01_00639, partial [Aureobasidium pullulans]